MDQGSDMIVDQGDISSHRKVMNVVAASLGRGWQKRIVRTVAVFTISVTKEDHISKQRWENAVRVANDWIDKNNSSGFLTVNVTFTNKVD
jgi:hypothetical protein